MGRLWPKLTLGQAIALVLLALAGIYLRVWSPDAESKVGFDEYVYSSYVEQLSQDGPGGYPAMAGRYITAQKASEDAIPTPTRMGIIVAATAWQMVFKSSALGSVHAVSCASSILVLLIATIFAWRLKGATFSVALLSLMAFNPLELCLAHRALTDSLVCLVVVVILGSLWELLHRPSRVWLAVYGTALTLLVLTKENAAFPYLGICSLLVANRWLKIGKVQAATVWTTILAPMLGGLILGLSVGGFGVLAQVYSLAVSSASHTPYVVATGNGPWFRYLLDLFLLNPAVILLAVAGAFSLTFVEKPGLYFVCFVVACYLPMCNVPHGVNVRYASIWDVPFSFLALLPVFRVQQAMARVSWKKTFLVVVLATIAWTEIWNYTKIFVDGDVYDPTPAYVLRALGIVQAR